MMKKLAALGLTAALAFAPMVAYAEDAAPAAAPAADTAAPGAEAPMKMKSHKMKHHMKMKSHKMKKMKKMDAPADAPAPDAPK